MASSIASFAAADGYKLMLNLQWVLFERTTYPCDPVGPTRLRSDWQARLATYKQHAAGQYNSSNVAYIVVHTEPNNSPAVTQADRVNAAKQVAAEFPGIPRAAGYPTTPPSTLPSVFPWPLSIIYTWDYSVPDPLHSSYVNGRFASVLSRLRNDQRIGVLIEGFGGDSIGISGVNLRLLAGRWCQLAKQQDKITRVAGFFWGENISTSGGTDYIIHQEAAPGPLEAAHRLLAKAADNQGAGPCPAVN